MKITLPYLLLCLLLVSHAFSQAPLTPEEREAKADKVFESWNDKNVPGAAVLMIKEGEIVYDKYFGSANLEYGIPINEQTRFHVASLSKQFTAFAALLLQAEGKLSMDDDIRKYLTELPDFGDKITLMHLATHTSGLREQWALLSLAGWIPGDVYTTKQILTFVERQKALNFIPGDELMYSNTGYTLLAEIVARVSGQSFAEYTQEHIFKPLGMKHSFFYDDHEEIMKNRAYSYHKEDEVYKKSTLSFSTVGPTSLFTTTRDMAKWVMNFYEPSLGGQKLIDQMNTLYVLNNGEESEAALGQFGKVKYGGLEWFDHTGSDAGYRAYLGRYPESKSAIIVFANVADFRASSQGYQVVNIYLREFFTEIGAKPKKIFVPDPKEFIKLSPQEMEKFCGKYWEANERYERKIIMENDTLTFFRSENNKTKLVPIKKNVFKMLGDSEDVDVIFDQNEKGEDRMRLDIKGVREVEYLAYSSTDPSAYVGEFYSEELGASYTLRVEKDQLILNHIKRGDFKLEPIKNNLFRSKDRNFKQLAFERDAKGKLLGFYISNGGIRNLWVEKK